MLYYVILCVFISSATEKRLPTAREPRTTAWERSRRSTIRGRRRSAFLRKYQATSALRKTGVARTNGAYRTNWSKRGEMPPNEVETKITAKLVETGRDAEPDAVAGFVIDRPPVEKDWCSTNERRVHHERVYANRARRSNSRATNRTDCELILATTN